MNSYKNYIHSKDKEEKHMPKESEVKEGETIPSPRVAARL